MRKLLFMLLATVGLTFASRAVVITWDTEELESDAASAELIYFASDPGSLSFDSSGNVIDGTSYTATGFTAQKAYESGMSTDVGSSEPDTGVWYVVLFNSDRSEYKSFSIAANTPNLYSSGEWDPMRPDIYLGDTGGMGTITMPTAWTPTPEPCSVALLLLGAAAMATRRKKLSI